jgi:peptidase E
MKLLLTSNGLSNDSIAKAFAELIGKDPKDAKVAFIPTASNLERGNKSWLIDDMYRIKEQGYAVEVVSEGDWLVLNGSAPNSSSIT